MESGRPLTSAIDRMRSNSVSRSTRSATSLQDYRAGPPRATGDAEELVGAGRQARASGRPSDDRWLTRPGGREAQGPPPGCSSAARLCHRGDLLRRGRLGAVRAAATHHVAPQGARGGTGRRRRPRDPLQHVEVLGERLPGPR